MLTSPRYEITAPPPYAMGKIEASARRIHAALVPYFHATLYDSFNTVLWECGHKHADGHCAEQCAQRKLRLLLP